MKNQNEQKGFQLTEEGQRIFANKKQENELGKRQGEKNKNDPSRTSPRKPFLEKPAAQNNQNDQSNQQPSAGSVSNQENAHSTEERAAQINTERSFNRELNIRDEQLAQDIQEAIEKEMSLSVAASNIQVVAESGIVTLEGKVSTKEERMIAGDIAVAFAGFGKVNNYLDVINPKKW
jgi:osmotically-inducible protein OsmY